MKGNQYLTRTAQYRLVYNKGGSWLDRLLVLRALPNGLEYSRYGLTVSRRLGTAVERNRVKRRLREILRQLPLKPGWDLVFIARPPASKVKFDELQHSVGKLLSRARLLTE